MIHFTSRVILPDAIKIIDNSSSVLIGFACSNSCYFQAYNGIIFKPGSMFGPNVKFISSNHNAFDRSMHDDKKSYRGRKELLGQADQ